jgi:DNA-binding NarL/FixJ family response regulator
LKSDMNRKARILIVDDHPMIRIGLTDLIANEPDMEVCGECTDATGVPALIEAHQPDVIIIDIVLENSNGLTLIEGIKKTNKSMKMLVYSMHDELLFGPRAIRAGALGYVDKHSHPTEVIEAIRKIIQGKPAIGDRLAEVLLTRMASGGEEHKQDSVALLSNRELEVFEMLGRGAKVREIAQKLGRSVKTIDTHRERIMTKLDLDSGAKLIRHAVEWVVEQDRLHGPGMSRA